MNEINPGLILILGALLIPVLPGLLRGAYMLALPLAALAYLLQLPIGEFGQLPLFDMGLVTLRIDKLSLAFGYVFLIATFLGVTYALHVSGWVQHTAGLVYAGSAIGGVFAGDLITLFVFWELTAISSVFLIWAARTPTAQTTSLRYLVIQIGSGVILLAGILMYYRDTGSIAFGAVGTGTQAGWLILIAIGIKCAFPFVHTWLKNAYPEATVTGAVILSIFTTKLAVYALARGYAGSEILIGIGAVMAAFPIVYAIIENDLRRVLAYALISQLGIMVVGVGIGSELAVNGAVAHAASGIFYFGLLFMAVGAVLYRAGTAKASELGGLYRFMPWTTAFAIIGALSIAAMPLFAGFVSKSLILSAAGKGGEFWAWLIMLAASATAVVHTAAKIPYFAFFARDAGKRCSEAPLNMLAAMAMTGAMCLAIGVYPEALYEILPHNVSYAPYTSEHIITQLQMVVFAGLAFAVLVRQGLFPLQQRATYLDVDWFYRRPGHALARFADRYRVYTWEWIADKTVIGATKLYNLLYKHHGPRGWLGRTWPTGTMAFWTTVMLGAVLLVAYV